jgi:hypothetical protein
LTDRVYTELLAAYQLLFKVYTIFMSLLYISQQITIYSGFFLLLVGLIGNGMNIWIFSRARIYRRISCSFFFLVGSIDNTLNLLINLTTRIMIGGYGIDFTSTSSFWCKTRPFLADTLNLISFTCSCLAVGDQFLVTSRNASLRRCSNIKWAQRIVFVMIIAWCLHGIPYFLYFHISPISNTCVNTNAIYSIYLTIDVFVFLCIAPVLFMIVFGYLAYRNIRLTEVLAGEHADRQLIRMTQIQVMLVMISVVPYLILSIYNVITTGVAKDASRQQDEYFASTIINLITYLHSVVCSFILYQII